MNPAFLFVVFAALLSSAATAFEANWTSGLQVEVEALPGETAINGMRFGMVRVTGRDVTKVTARIYEKWMRDDSERVRILHHGGWIILSRLDARRSQVAQYREDAARTELIWSETTLGQVPEGVDVPGYLTSRCEWLAPVHGVARETRYLQFTGHCADSQQDVLSHLEASLERHGWSVQRLARGIDAARNESRLRAVITEVTEGSGVVVVQTTPRGKGLP